MTTGVEGKLAKTVGNCVKSAYHTGFLDGLTSALNYLERLAAVEDGIPNTAMKVRLEIELLRDHCKKDWEKRNLVDAPSP